MKRLALFASALLVATTASAGTYWTVRDNVAETTFPTQGISIGILFSPDSNCESALLAVLGNPNIEKVALAVDDNIFRASDVSHATDFGVGLWLSTNALKALKHGREAFLVTSEGSLTMSLKGSARALNSAYAYCLAEVAVQNPALRPLEAAAPRPTKGMTTQRYDVQF